MTPETQKVVKRALENAQGDDLYRARAAWDGLSDVGLDTEYGESGKTRRQILAEYEAHDAAIKAAKAELDL